jgi:hypothetical protein
MLATPDTSPRFKPILNTFIKLRMSARDSQERWESLSAEMRKGNPPLHDPTKINIPVSASARIRFEPNSRDAMNSRIWESIKYDTPAPNSNDIANSHSPILQDNNPISSRISMNNYNNQAQFFPNPERSRDSIIGETQQQPGLIKNPFLQRLDAVNDGRNMPREMRAAVYEDNRERDIEASRVLVERQFSHRFLPEQEAATIQSIKAFELLRPKIDDYSKSYR